MQLAKKNLQTIVYNPKITNIWHAMAYGMDTEAIFYSHFGEHKGPVQDYFDKSVICIIDTSKGE